MPGKIDMIGQEKTDGLLMGAFQDIEIRNYRRAENIANMLEGSPWKEQGSQGWLECSWRMGIMRTLKRWLSK
jgi:hypothetical protein